MSNARRANGTKTRRALFAGGMEAVTAGTSLGLGVLGTLAIMDATAAHPGSPVAVADVVAPVEASAATDTGAQLTCDELSVPRELAQVALAFETCDWSVGLTRLEARWDGGGSWERIDECWLDDFGLALEHRDTLAEVERLRDAGQCLRAKRVAAPLAELRGYGSCLDALADCAAVECRADTAAVAQSERRLQQLLGPAPIVTQVTFRPTPADRCTWDIAVEGDWGLLVDGPIEPVAIGLTGILGVIGDESARTPWASRYLVLEQFGECELRIATSKARRVARELERALQAQSPRIAADTVFWAVQQFEEC